VSNAVINTALASNQPAPAEYANALTLGSALMEYRLERVLGAGGFGITYLGWDCNLEKHVAIKEYLPTQLAVRALDGSVVPLATEQKYDYLWGLERFVQEARTLAKFSHPHIVRVLRYLEANNTAYMVMEYEAGESLAQWLKTHCSPSENDLREILGPLLDGLDAVHAQGFLHRDIKPANVFIRADGKPVLIDFGAARQAVGHKSVSLTSIVSPGYAPLEQYASDGNQGPWTDVYSLSAVLFRAITGQNPPEAISRMKIDRVCHRLDSAQQRYSETFIKAVKLGMAIDEKLRPQSVAEWRSVLFDQRTQCVASTPTQPGTAPAATTVRASAVTAPPVSAPPGGSRSSAERHASFVAPPARRRPWLLAAVLFSGLVALYAVQPWNRTNRLEPVPKSNKTLPVQSVQSAVVTQAPPAPEPEPALVRQPVAETVVRTEEQAREPVTQVQATPALVQEPPPQRAFVKPPPPKGHLAKTNAGVVREFHAADADGDGALTLAEARSGMPKLAQEFALVDANGDGRVTPFELQRHMQMNTQRGFGPPKGR
jgi:serine/threonine protein kinase